MRGDTAASQLLMRQHNLSLTLMTILDDGQATRADLARHMGLSKPALTRIIGDLIAAGFVTELGPGPASGRGRPGTRLVPRAGSHAFLGIDLRLDRIVVQARDLTGEILAETASPHEPPASSADLVSALVAAVRDFAATLGRSVSGIGVAVGGSVDERGERIVTSAHTAWRDIPVARYLRDAVDNPRARVRLADVARCAASANWRAVSHDPEVEDLVHLQVGVGVGAGRVERRWPMPDPHVPGPMAHLPIDPNGPECPCGARGCLDVLVGFPAFVELARPGTAVPSGPHAMQRFCADVLARADDGDARAVAAIDTVAARIGDAAAMLISLFAPSCLTIGGYPLVLDDRFRTAFLDAVRPRLPDIENILTTSGLEDEASLVGAYLLGVAAVAEDPLHLGPVAS